MIRLLFELNKVHIPLLISHWRKLRAWATGLGLGEPQSLDNLVVKVGFLDALADPNLKI